MQFWLGIRNSVTTVSGFLIAAIFFKTIEAMAWAWTITLIINFAFIYWLLYRYVLHTSIVPMLKELVFPSFVGVVVGLLLVCLNALDITGGLFTSIIIKGSSSVLLVLLMIQVSGRYDIISTIRGKLKFKNKLTKRT